jgi:hypothetical protein
MHFINSWAPGSAFLLLAFITAAAFWLAERMDARVVAVPFCYYWMIDKEPGRRPFAFFGRRRADLQSLSGFTTFVRLTVSAIGPKDVAGQFAPDPYAPDQSRHSRR